VYGGKKMIATLRKERSDAGFDEDRSPIRGIMKNRRKLIGFAHKRENTDRFVEPERACVGKSA